MHDTRKNAAYIALAALFLGCFLTWALVGCGSEAPQYQRTKHLVIEANGYDVDVDALDATWVDVGICYGKDPNRQRGAHVVIEDPVAVVDGYQLFACDKSLSPSGLCYGWSQWDRRIIHLPPDGKAMRHESAECWAPIAGGSMVHGDNPKCGM